jgi:hypothetical protein
MNILLSFRLLGIIHFFETRSSGAVVIDPDTDGILFSHPDPQGVTEASRHYQRESISNWSLATVGDMFQNLSPKSYVIVYPDGKTTIKKGRFW